MNPLSFVANCFFRRTLQEKGPALTLVGVFEPPLSIKGRYAVTQDNIVKFAEPGAFEDPLTGFCCGARKLLAQTVDAEVSDFLDRHSDFLTEEGQQRLVTP